MTDKRYRSRFEMDFATFLEMNNVKYDYESQKIKYTPKTRTYTPDFHLLDYDILIETKGQFGVLTLNRIKAHTSQYFQLNLLNLVLKQEAKKETSFLTPSWDLAQQQWSLIR